MSQKGVWPMYALVYPDTLLSERFSSIPGVAYVCSNFPSPIHYWDTYHTLSWGAQRLPDPPGLPVGLRRPRPPGPGDGGANGCHQNVGGGRPKAVAPHPLCLPRSRKGQRCWLRPVSGRGGTPRKAERRVWGREPPRLGYGRCPDHHRCRQTLFGSDDANT